MIDNVMVVMPRPCSGRREKTVMAMYVEQQERPKGHSSAKWVAVES